MELHACTWTISFYCFCKSIVGKSLERSPAIREFTPKTQFTLWELDGCSWGSGFSTYEWDLSRVLSWASPILFRDSVTCLSLSIHMLWTAKFNLIFLNNFSWKLKFYHTKIYFYHFPKIVLFFCTFLLLDKMYCLLIFLYFSLTFWMSFWFFILLINLETYCWGKKKRKWKEHKNIMLRGTNESLFF